MKYIILCTVLCILTGCNQPPTINIQEAKKEVWSKHAWYKTRIDCIVEITKNDSAKVFFSDYVPNEVCRVWIPDARQTFRAWPVGPHDKTKCLIVDFNYGLNINITELYNKTIYAGGEELWD